MNLYVWARKWGVPDDAINDLRLQMGIDPSQPQDKQPPVLNSETAVQKHRRMQAARRGALLWRNNVGAATDERGHHVRYGLANESAAINKKVKSSDLVGITPVLVTPEHVGLTFGVFTAEECKRPGWRWTGSDRELAQRKFHEIVLSKGGIARFTNGIDEYVMPGVG